MDLADGLHITRLPEVRQRILDGTFHTKVCRSCGHIGIVHTKTLYTDFDRWHWVAVAPPWLIHEWPRWEHIVRDEFEHNMRVAAPPMVKALADNFAVRLVFGFDALAEKLRAWDAGLDDRMVEALKVRVAMAHLGDLGPGFRLRLVRASRETWDLELEATLLGRKDRIGFVLSLDEYLTMEATSDHPSEAIATPFGGVDRLFAESLGGAAAQRPYLTVVGSLRPQDDSPAYPLPDDLRGA
jgi:hypothetical protein